MLENFWDPIKSFITPGTFVVILASLVKKFENTFKIKVNKIVALARNLKKKNSSISVIFIQ